MKPIMPSALILGGHGKVAQHLTKQLVSLSYTVHSVIRSQSQFDQIRSLGASPILHSLDTTTTSSLSDLISSLHPRPDVLVWAAGAGGKGGPERTNAVDRDAAIAAWDAAARTGLKRVVVVSAVDVREREKKKVPEWYDSEDMERSERMLGAIGTYMRAKFEADRSLVTGNKERGLEYTIVRPTGLSDEGGRGKVEAGKVHLKTVISREDVAAVVVQCIRDEGTIGLAFDVVGGETPIAEAVSSVVKDRVDTYEGFY